MGCGKSKHDVVASANTILRRKKSSVRINKDQEVGAQTKEVNNENVMNSGAEVQKDGNNNNVVKEVVEEKVNDDVGVVTAGENNENVVEKITEEVGVVVDADEVEGKTEKTDLVEEVKEEEKKDKEVDDGEEGLVVKEVSEEVDALKLNENDQKVIDDAPLEEENKNGDGNDDASVKEEIVAVEEAPRDIVTVAAPDGEDKDLKVEEN